MMKRALYNPLVMVFLDFSCDLVLKFDASDVAIGVVLS